MTENEMLLLVRDELRGWARNHAAIKAGHGNIEDVDGFADWLVTAFSEPHIIAGHPPTTERWAFPETGQTVPGVR